MTTTQTVEAIRKTGAPLGDRARLEPPHRLVLEWKVNPDAVAPTEIEVRFTAEGGGTRVNVEHRGWERLGDKTLEDRAASEGGWPGVLARYEQAATA